MSITATTVDTIEDMAREHYEAARKRVSGRPAWEDLNPNDDYDMGMREYAMEQARATRRAELGIGE